MSAEAVQVVRAMFTAWERGDVEAMLMHVDEAVVWHPSVWSSGGVSYHGHEGIREWAAQFAQPSRRIEVKARELRAGPAAVAVIGEVAEFSGGVRTTTLRVGWVFEVSGGRIVRGEGFSDPAHALRIAGVWD